MASIVTYFDTFTTIARSPSGISGTWLNPTNTQIEDNSGSQYSYTSGASGNSDFLKCSDLHDSVPTGSTIDGLSLRIKRRAYKSPLNFQLQVTDESVYFEYLGSNSTNKADTVTLWDNLTPGANPEFAFSSTYGSSSDKWGLTLTDSIINNSNFSLYLAITLTSDSASPNLNNIAIDYVEVTVYYTPPGSGAQRPRIFLIT